MKRAIIFILLSVFLGNLNANCQKLKSDYFKYYQDIYQAEKQICRNEFDSALFFYNKAFRSYENRFYYDMYNAAICASKTNNYDQLDKILQNLAGYGYEINFIDSNQLIIIDSLNNFNYSKVLKKQKRSFEKNINSKLESECILRVEKDQSTDRQRINDGKAESLKVFHEVGYENIDWLTEIINSHGYPNRKLIGYSYEPNYSIVGIMLIHYFQHKIIKYEPAFRDSLMRDFIFSYEEDSIINQFDRIPVLKIISHEVSKGNMNLGEYVKYHNIARTLNEGKSFYKLFYKSDTYPPIFDSNRDSVLITASLELEKLIANYKKTKHSEFQLGKSLYRLSTNEDYKELFESKF
jgi:hypothetical protein